MGSGILTSCQETRRCNLVTWESYLPHKKTFSSWKQETGRSMQINPTFSLHLIDCSENVWSYSSPETFNKPRRGTCWGAITVKQCSVWGCIFVLLCILNASLFYSSLVVLGSCSPNNLCFGLWFLETLWWNTYKAGMRNTQPDILNLILLTTYYEAIFFFLEWKLGLPPDLNIQVMY